METGHLIASEQELEATQLQIADKIREVFNCDLVTLFSYNEKDHMISYPMTFSGNPIFKDLLVNPQLENAFRKVKINLLAEHSVITKLLQYDQNCFADITTGHPVLDAGKFVWRKIFALQPDCCYV